MISCSILEKELASTTNKIENVEAALEHHKEEFTRYESELEFYTKKQVDLKSAIDKLKS